MPCCKADEFGWCRKVEVVPRTHGNKYCVFHSPVEDKKMELKQFNKEIFSRIDSAIKSNKKCDLSGTIFMGDIDFSRYNEANPFPEINLCNSSFYSRAKFSNTVFSKKASFIKATFAGDTDFKGAIFAGDTDFTETTFDEDTNFSNATFEDDVNFLMAKFNSDVFFEITTFCALANFRLSDFKWDAKFANTKFEGNTIFHQADFFGPIADFSDAEFSEKASFNNVRCIRMDFIRASFSPWIRFDDISVEGRILFTQIHGLENVYFPLVDLEKFHFMSCEWPRTKGRRILLNEEQTRENLSNKRKFNSSIYKENVVPVFQLEYAKNVYRKLKEKYLAEHNHTEASQWHYCEKEMARQQDIRSDNIISINKIYYICSGYGERWTRAGTVLLVLFSLFMGFMAVAGLKAGGNVPDYVNGLEIGLSVPFSPEAFLKGFWVLIVTALQNILFRAPYMEPTGPIGVIIIIFFGKILIPIQATLFVLALRNPFRR
jgi:hypothetical protein